MNSKNGDSPVLSTIASWLVTLLLVSQVGLSALILYKIDPSLFVIQLKNPDLQSQLQSSQPEYRSEYRSPVYVGNVPENGYERVKGNLATAKVTIIVFGDYECPYCVQAHLALKDLMEKYPDQIAYVYLDYPLSTHQNAFLAAESAHCAGDQGKYWEMHDMLFADQTKLGLESIRVRAQKLGIDIEQFDECMVDHKYKSKIEETISLGNEYGVKGTPTIFINGYQVGIPDLGMVEVMIEKE